MKKKHYIYTIILSLAFSMLCGCSEASKETAGKNTTYMEYLELEKELVYALPKVGEALIGENPEVNEEGNIPMPVKESITIATIGHPNTEILQKAAELLSKKGYQMDIVECEDYQTPNEMVEQGRADGNFFQHNAYLKRYNIEKGTSLVEAAKIHYEPLIIYSQTAESLQDIGAGARIAVPSNATGYAQALFLLEQEGLLEMMSDADLTAVKGDISSNPLSLELIEVKESEMLANQEKYDAVICHMSYVLQQGIDAEQNILAMEEKDSLSAQNLAQGLVVQADEKDSMKAEEEETENEESANDVTETEVKEDTNTDKSDALQALIEVLHSEEMETFIEEQYHGSIYLMSGE